jgi:hypothetical protein
MEIKSRRNEEDKRMRWHKFQKNQTVHAVRHRSGAELP